MFSKTQIKIIKFDDLRSDTGKVYTQLCTWLGVNDEIFPKDRGIKNSASQPRIRLVHYLLKRGGGPIRKFVKQIIPLTLLSPLKQSLIQWNLKEEKNDPIPLALRRRIWLDVIEDIQKLEALTGLSFAEWRVD